MGRNSELAEKFFGAITAGDAEVMKAMCAPDFVLRQNGGQGTDVESFVALTLAVRRAAPDFRYENSVRSDTADGFVEEHSVRGTLPDGTEFQLAACVVARIDGGKIVACQEYFDTAAAAGLFRALGA